MTLLNRTGLRRAASYFGTYTLWTLAFHLVVLTLITWLLSSSRTRLQDISDFYGANELTLAGLSALGYVLLLLWLNPLTSSSREELVNSHRFEKRFAPGFFHGSVLALGVTLAFLLGGVYRYIGFYITLAEAPLALLGILLRIVALIAMVYCEEFIFRHKIMGYLRREMKDVWAILLAATLYCIIKAIQFDIGWTQLLTLMLLALGLGVRTVVDGDFARGAGFWAGLLVIFHPFLSLPVLGNDVQGVLLVKLQMNVPALADAGSGGAMFRYLTGGYGGPLSSLALQLLLLIDLVQAIVKHRRILLN